MADVNITNCTASPQKCSKPAGTANITFHAADEQYTLYFSNAAILGAQATIPQGGSPTSLPVLTNGTTGYCITGTGCPSTPPCPPPPSGAADGDPFEITIGSPIPKPKPKVKAAVKRAANVTAKAKGKAKPKPKAKAAPKKKAAVKAKGKAKPKPAAKAKKKR